MSNKKNNINKQVISSDNEVGKLIKMVVIVTVLFLAFYFLTIIITGKDKKDDTTKEEEKVEIQYNNILVGNLLTQPNDVYYVLVKDADDKNNATYQAYLEVYSKLEKASRVYYADLKNPLNAKFIGETTVTNITNILDLRLKGTTLLKIEKGKITKVYEDKDNLIKFLYELAEIKEEEKK